MNIIYKEIICMIPSEVPSDKVLAGIFERVEKAECLRLRTRALAHGVLVVGAVGAFVPAIIYLISSANESGFAQFLSLLSSDSSYVMSDFSGYMLSIAATIPIVAGVACLGLLFISARSARKIADYSSSLKEHMLMSTLQSA